MSQIEHLVTLQSPNGGLSKSKAQLLYWNTEVFICNGTRFVYVFSIEKKHITAVYQFPSIIWHIELCAGSSQLYVLCAQNGLYLLEWNEQGRLLMEPSSAMNKGDLTVYQIGSHFGLLLDPSLCSFTVANEVLVVVLVQQDKWKITMFQRESLHREDLFTAPSREVKFSHSHGMNSRGLQPVLCCASLWKEKAVRTDAACNVALNAVLFTRLFGVDVAILESPMILCGFPDGQVVSFPLKSAGMHQFANQSLSKLLYHLEQPVVSIGAIKMEPCNQYAEQPSMENRACNCLLIVGQKGLIVSVTGSDNPDAVSCVYKDYKLPAPVSCTSYSASGVFCCTSSDLIHVTIPHLEKEAAASTADFTVSSCFHNIPMLVALSQASTLGDTHLVALSKRGCLMLYKVNPKRSADQQHGLNCVNAGERIKELLSGIGSASERFSALKTVADEKRGSLAKLSQAMSLSQELLSGLWTTCPVRCAIRVSWTHMLHKAYMTVYCNLQNNSDYVLEHGWTLCLLISTDPITSYTFPVLLLKSRETKEFAFPLCGQKSHSVNFPLQITCFLFYSLKGFAEHCGNPSELYMCSSYQHGVCIPVQDHVLDILQCLRLSPSAAYCSGLSHTFPEDAVQAIWKSSSESDQLGASSMTVSNQGSNSTLPLKASVRLSAVLLAHALRNEPSDSAATRRELGADAGPPISQASMKTLLNRRETATGRSLCCVVLHWLLADVLVKKQDLQEVRGLTPDGKEFCIRVQEVSVSHLSLERSIQAVEVQILSSYLHVVAALHLAVICRFKILLQQDEPNSDGLCQGLNFQKVQHLFTAQELLLKEVKDLRARLGMDEDIICSAAAQRLLHIYRDLRDPGLFFV